MKPIFLIGFIVLISSTACSQKISEINQDWDTLAISYAECSAYFGLVYSAYIESGEHELSNEFLFLEDDTKFYSQALASNGRDGEQALSLTISRIELFTQQLSNEFNARTEEIPLLTNDYHENCIFLYRNPPEASTEAISEFDGPIEDRG